ncbi:MAG: hypothetical protein PVF49_05375 [Anaerolineales bacterium]
MPEAPSQTEITAPESASVRGISPTLGCGVLLVCLIVGLVCVWVAGALAFEGEIQFRAGQPDEIRLWLVDDEGIAGLALSYAGEAVLDAGDSLHCYQHQVRFFLWRSADQGQPVEFCRCYQTDNGDWIDVGACADF